MSVTFKEPNQCQTYTDNNHYEMGERKDLGSHQHLVNRNWSQFTQSSINYINVKLLTAFFTILVCPGQLCKRDFESQPFFLPS